MAGRRELASPVLGFLILVAGILSGAATEPTSTSASFTLLPGEPGAGGGRATSASFTADTATGSGIEGGVSTITNVGGFQSKDGYTGQLYDAATVVVSAAPGATLNEGDAVQLSAQVTMKDDSTLDTTDVIWSIENGPIASLDAGGLAIAGSVTANAAALVQGLLDGVAGELDLTIVNQPFASNTLTWDDPTPGGNGPYKVFFGTTSGALLLAASPSANFFNPGQLDLGTEYFFRILDDSDTDITPGGPGEQSFTTDLFQADMRIGTRAPPATHRGNGIYNLNGGGQLAKIKLIGRKKGKVFFSVENDGDVADAHSVRGTKASKNFKFIKYFRSSGGRANITAAATRAGYVHMADLAPGELVTYEIQVKANGKKRAAQTLRVSTKSTGDARGADLAKSKLNGIVKK